MSLLDDARQLLEWSPKTPFCECVFCDAFLGGCGIGDHGDEERPHEEGCPWLAMAGIVEALARLEGLEK